MNKALLGAVCGALLLVWSDVRAGADAPTLAFFKNYFITGDYVVGGTSLWRKGVSGVAAGSIEVNGVPENADIVAAFLYVQTAEVVQGSGIDRARFDGVDLGPASSSIAKALNWDQATAPCWSVNLSGGKGRRLVTYRADVLRFLPIGANGKTRANGAHTLQVPDSGKAFPDTDEIGIESGGTTGPRAIGASLLVVYRDSSSPYRGIVIQDGGITKKAFETATMPLSGFYQASTQPGARLTAVVGDGRPFLSERLRVNGQLIATNPFGSTAGGKWDNPTFTNLPVPAGAASTTVRIEPHGLLSDCVSLSALVFSTEVQDSDRDGLIDIWESSATPVLDPNGQPLPNLAAMGADPHVQDVFVEIGYMFAAGAPTYGGVAKPAHSHLPSHEALKLVGDAFANAPTGRINVHFDVGESYPPGDADPYIIRGAGLARGGEAIDERVTVCTRAAGDPPDVCQYSAHPGTVGWKTGFQFMRDAVISGPAPVPGAEDPCDAPGAPCVRRFDRNRKDIFRYALFAHAVGLPSSDDPQDPRFQVPRTFTGVGDFPGGDYMVTLGAFDDASGLPVGTPFMQASTMMHEMGHGFERRHGGDAFAPNCNPLYFSPMNYAYQLRGLLDDAGVPHLDFSRDAVSGFAIDETALADGSLSHLPYRIGWYAPLATSYLSALGTPVAKHCDGSPLLPGDAPMVRIDARTAASAIDWRANGTADTGPFTQDVNFNGRTMDGGGSPEILTPSNDWAAILLNQVGSRRSAGGLFVDTMNRFAVGPLSLDTGRGDLGRGDLGRGDLGRGDLGRGDLGRGDLGRGDLGTILGRGDLGRGDLGGGDLFVGRPGEPIGELDFETAGDLAKTPPNELRACVLGENCPSGATPLHRIRLDWTTPTVGAVSGYEVWRVVGPDLTPTAVASATLVGQVNAVLGQIDYSLVDTTPLVNGQSYTYFARARYADGTISDPSNAITIVAVNDVPIVSDIQDRSIDANTSTGPIAFTIADDDLPSVVLSASSSNTTLVPAANIVFGGSGGNRTVTVTPAPNRSGTATIAVTVTDSGGQSASDSFVLTVATKYTFVNIKNAPPPAGSKVTAGSALPLRWAFTNGSARVDSSSVGHVVTVVGPLPGGPVRTFTNTDPGKSGFGYSAPAKTWEFNLQTRDADGRAFPAGTYQVTIAPAAPGFPGATFQLRVVK